MASTDSRHITFGKSLAASKKQTRDATLKKLRTWLAHQTSVTPLEMKKVWEGLYACMWMSDKPLIQEECAQNIAELIHALPASKGIMFFEVFLETLTRKWHSIDRLRLDKFYWLLARGLEQALKYLSSTEWDGDNMTRFAAAVIAATPGIQLHLAKTLVAAMNATNPPPDAISAILEPFLTVLATTQWDMVQKRIIETVFVDGLIAQLVARAEYEAEREAAESEGAEFVEDAAGAPPVQTVDWPHVATWLFTRATDTATLPANRTMLYKLLKSIKNTCPLNGWTEASVPIAAPKKERVKKKKDKAEKQTKKRTREDMESEDASLDGEDEDSGEDGPSPKKARIEEAGPTVVDAETMKERKRERKRLRKTAVPIAEEESEGGSDEAASVDENDYEALMAARGQHAGDEEEGEDDLGSEDGDVDLDQFPELAEGLQALRESGMGGDSDDECECGCDSEADTVPNTSVAAEEASDDEVTFTHGPLALQPVLADEKAEKKKRKREKRKANAKAAAAASVDTDAAEEEENRVEESGTATQETAVVRAAAGRSGSSATSMEIDGDEEEEAPAPKPKYRIRIIEEDLTPDKDLSARAKRKKKNPKHQGDPTFLDMTEPEAKKRRRRSKKKDKKDDEKEQQGSGVRGPSKRAPDTAPKKHLKDPMAVKGPLPAKLTPAPVAATPKAAPASAPAPAKAAPATAKKPSVAPTPSKPPAAPKAHPHNAHHPPVPNHTVPTPLHGDIKTHAHVDLPGSPKTPPKTKKSAAVAPFTVAAPRAAADAPSKRRHSVQFSKKNFVKEFHKADKIPATPTKPPATPTRALLKKRPNDPTLAPRA